MSKKINELVACVRRAEAQQSELGTASAQLHKILLEHANT